MASEIETYLRGEARKHPARWNWNGEHLLISSDRAVVDSSGLPNFVITSVLLEPDEARSLRDWLNEYLDNDGDLAANIRGDYGDNPYRPELDDEGDSEPNV